MNNLQSIKVYFLDRKLQAIKKKNDKKELEILNNDIKQINNNLDLIYIDKLNKKITEEQFERVKLKLENELLIKQDKYNDLNVNDIIDEESKNKIIGKYINKFLSMKEINRELIINLVDKIETDFVTTRENLAKEYEVSLTFPQNLEKISPQNIELSRRCLRL